MDRPFIPRKIDLSSLGEGCGGGALNAFFDSKGPPRVNIPPILDGDDDSFGGDPLVGELGFDMLRYNKR
jgi:hypothetical protein